MNIAIGSDHAAFLLKEEIKKFLIENGHNVKDFGANSCHNPVDYPDIAQEVAKVVANCEFEKGIILCGTGIGASIAANKVKGIRAALCNDVVSAKLSREHNDANILAMGGRIIGSLTANEIVKAWLVAEFKGDRHQRRLDKIKKIEE